MSPALNKGRRHNDDDVNKMNVSHGRRNVFDHEPDRKTVRSTEPEATAAAARAALLTLVTWSGAEHYTQSESAIPEWVCLQNIVLGYCDYNVLI